MYAFSTLHFLTQMMNTNHKGSPWADADSDEECGRRTSGAAVEAKIDYAMAPRSVGHNPTNKQEGAWRS